MEDDIIPRCLFVMVFENWLLRADNIHWGWGNALLILSHKKVPWLRLSELRFYESKKKKEKAKQRKPKDQMPTGT